MDEVTIGDEIEWLDIHPDGREVTRRGYVWSPAPALKGMRTWWVIPADLQRGVVRVARAAKRHRCGRDLAAPHGPHRYYPGQGRVIDPGELYRETDPRSPFTLADLPPRYARLRPMTAGSRNEYENYLAVLAQAERDRDESVSDPGHARPGHASGEVTL